MPLDSERRPFGDTSASGPLQLSNGTDRGLGCHGSRYRDGRPRRRACLRGPPESGSPFGPQAPGPLIQARWAGLEWVKGGRGPSRSEAQPLDRTPARPDDLRQRAGRCVCIAFSAGGSGLLDRGALGCARSAREFPESLWCSQGSSSGAYVKGAWRRRCASGRRPSLTCAPTVRNGTGEGPRGCGVTGGQGARGDLGRLGTSAAKSCGPSRGPGRGWPAGAGTPGRGRRRRSGGPRVGVPAVVGEDGQRLPGMAVGRHAKGDGAFRTRGLGDWFDPGLGGDLLGVADALQNAPDLGQTARASSCRSAALGRTDGASGARRLSGDAVSKHGTPTSRPTARAGCRWLRPNPVHGASPQKPTRPQGLGRGEPSAALRTPGVSRRSSQAAPSSRRHNPVTAAEHSSITAMQGPTTGHGHPPNPLTLNTSR